MDISTGSLQNPYGQIYRQNYITNYANGSGAVRNQGVSQPGVSEFNDPSIRMAKRNGIEECQTCKNRKYVDGSNDPGVSFKTPTHVDPKNAASAVMSHEQEHVRHETAKASAQDRKIISQSVQIETSVCPECGKVYVSGGKTTTTTKSDGDGDKKDFFKDNYNKAMSNHFGKSIDTRI